MDDVGKQVQRWADPAMFSAEPIAAEEGPKVYLLSMTQDPLGAIAAACKMYKGEVVRSYSDITDEERRAYLQQVLRTKLQAPFEFVQFHFMLEGVTRAFTHQLVRQRTAAYAQESLRFAVKEELPVAIPPSLGGTEGDFDHFQMGSDAAWAALSTADKMRAKWDACVSQIQKSYTELVNMGMPAEDARGLLPHNVLTRVHYTTNLRALLDHAGNRLCTQAQFEWRSVFAQIAQAIGNAATSKQQDFRGMRVYSNGTNSILMAEEIAKLFRPVCYMTGKCEFKADFDRPCSIRNRVDANHSVGRPSSEWGAEMDVVQGDPIVSGVGPQSVVRDERNVPVFIGPISPAEWLLDPGAAR